MLWGKDTVKSLCSYRSHQKTQNDVPDRHAGGAKEEATLYLARGIASPGTLFPKEEVQVLP